MQTYKFYTKKEERLAIFLREKENTSQIEVYRCSLDDSFNKKTARYAFHIACNKDIPNKEDCKFHPEIIKLDKKLTGKEFYQWCKDNYYTKVKTIEHCVVTYLVKNDIVYNISNVSIIEDQEF